MSTAANNKLTASSLPGYVIDALIFDGDPTRVYRARRASDNTPVMLKSLGHDRTLREASACLKHEFDMANRVQVSSVIKVYGLEQHRNTPVVVLEDFGGDSLDNLARQRTFSLEEVLGIAIQVAHGLGEIHAANIIHKDINPSNLVYNPNTRVLKIIDFGISSYLTREQAAIASPQVLEASLPYISPEQTGRMNRSVDYRTDYYSFGVTLYELLAGRPLFAVEEPIEWFHCHIAKRPQSLCEIAPAVPRMISDIVMKLLAKMAEDRYQSAQGIEADLQRCLDQLNATDSIEPFALGEKDIPSRFQIPQRLYGREHEVSTLLSIFDRVIDTCGELILVSGYSGIGKTCLIKEIYKPITERRGRFIAGKFDQLHRNIPYSALIAAMRDLVRQILTETEEKLSQWRNAILQALGTNAQLMSDTLRDLELIIGPQPAVAPLPAKEAEQRFHRVFHNFIQLFAQPQHPLVIFLDDLQWADSASLKIVEMLCNPDTGVSHLLLIGAYRDNEVHDGHPLVQAVNGLRKSGTRIEEIRLQPLNRTHLAQLLADTLSTSIAETMALAELVEQKTAGNPFFTEEFLKFLHKAGLIYFSAQSNRWCWNVDLVRAQQMTDNVVELMTTRLRQLTPETLDMLELGACIGNRFGLGTLSVVSQRAPQEILPWLKAGMTEGVIAPIGDAYQLLELDQMTVSELTVEFAFAHDRIQQAAYALMDEEQRRRAHLNIGRLLKRNASRNDHQQILFDITNHLNLGVQLIDARDERDQLCRLNLDAGRRARASSAHLPAYEYLKHALSLLPRDAWRQDYRLCLDIHVEAAEAAYLGTDYAASDQLIADGLTHAQSVLDEARLLAIKVSSLIARGQLREAVDLAKPILARLGHRYPMKTRRHHVVTALFRALWQMRDINIEALGSLPEMSDPYHLAAHDIGSRVGAAALFVEPEFFSLMIMFSVRVQLKHGHAPFALTAWTALGMVLATQLKQPQRGDELARMSLQLVERFQAKAIEGRNIHVRNALVRHWSEPLRNSLEPLQQAYRLALENGDFEYACLAPIVRLMHLFECGMELKQWREEVVVAANVIKPLQQGNMIELLHIFLKFVDSLTDGSEFSAAQSALETSHHDRAQSSDLSKVSLERELAIYRSFLLGDNTVALDSGRMLSLESSGFAGFFLTARVHMILALSRLQRAAKATGRSRRQLLHRARRDEAWLKQRALHCAENFRNKYLLVAAMRLHVTGNDFAAQKLFDESIRLAAEQGFMQEQALASEMCASMHVAAGRDTMANAYLTRARDLYQAWGATAKVEQLHALYPQLPRATRKSGTTSAPMHNVDIASLMKALKAIANEKIHSRMIETIIGAAVEFAGAEKGLLVLRNSDGAFCVEAELQIDGSNPKILQSLPLEKSIVPQTLMHYVRRTLTSVVVHDAQQASLDIPGLELDEQVQTRGLRSLLCLPVVNSSEQSQELFGLIYLENNLVSGAFTEQRFNTLEIIGMAAAGRLELSHRATLDGLTRLFNHDYFQNILAQHIASTRRRRRDLGLLLIDIDHFKSFNDIWGHQLGDQVLREVAQLIKSTCRAEDVVARYGGEEMAVILPETNQEQALEIGERVRCAVADHHVLHGGEKLKVTISLGLARFDAGSDSQETLIKRADEALYRSKREGRNRISVA